MNGLNRTSRSTPAGSCISVKTHVRIWVGIVEMTYTHLKCYRFVRSDASRLRGDRKVPEKHASTNRAPKRLTTFAKVS